MYIVHKNSVIGNFTISESKILIKINICYSSEEPTSSASISINPPLDLISSASVKIEDSALPAATTTKPEESEESLSQKESTKEPINQDNINTDNKTKNTVKDSTTEIVVMASVDTQSNEIKGKEKYEMYLFSRTINLMYV